ncbi:MAG: sodium:calcium antiporter [SAR202 cluster bacterium]|nr:sodium:calcium antiporter [SAR202 cluster bacterium]
MVWMIVAFLALVPGGVLVLGAFEAADPMKALLYGVAIVGAAFLLSWAAEVVQLDFSQGLALALLALIAILPEYVVDASFAWLAAEDPAYAGYAVANMTGANRLLIGIAWPVVILLVFLRFRRRRVELEESHGIELVALLAATAYAFIIPFKGSISLIDMAVLVSIFGFYVWRVARLPAEEPDLEGPARLIAELRPLHRRMVVFVLALVAAVAILLVAKPFAKALVATGVDLGIDEFLLVQWLAPLASEAPEFVVVVLFAWRGAATAALGTLVSSKVNQWTLLIATLPLVYSIALGGPSALPMDERQREEVLLTAAQSVFAITLLLNLRLSVLGAAVLFVLFAVQMVLPETRNIITIIYLALAAGVVIRSYRQVHRAFRWMRPQKAADVVAPH